MITQRIPRLAIGLILFSVSLAPGQELPGWLDHVTITPPPPGGLTAVTLGGVWNNTCVPNAISHVDAGRQIRLTVTQPGLNVFCGQAFTPWSLTEEIGPLQAGMHPISASLIAVDPTDRNIRQRLAGPDFIGQLEPKRAEFRGLGAGDVYNSRAYDVSADGRVVAGSNSRPTRSESQPNLMAFAWTPETGQIDLGVLPGGQSEGSIAFGVSADGNTVVGRSSTSDSLEAMRWTLGAGMQGIAGFGPVAVSSAHATSSDGSVLVGPDLGAFEPTPGGQKQKSFRWTEEGGFLDLGSLYPQGFTNARDTSADGNTIVGRSRADFSANVADGVISQAFVWQPATGIRSLGYLDPFVGQDLTGEAVYESGAMGVSASGAVVVGYSRATIEGDEAPVPRRTVQDAFRWTEETGMVALERLHPEDGREVAMGAVDVSGDGEFIVGMADFSLAGPFFAAADRADAQAPPNRADLREAFIWDAVRGTRPLRDVLMLDAGLSAEDSLTGWDLGEVTAISDDGTTVVGFGTNPQGEMEAWRAVMSHTFAAGDADFSGVVDFRDFLAMASSFGQPGQFWATGDFDADGRTDVRDFLALAANYEQPAQAGALQVPEPAGRAAMLTGLILLACAWRKRRRLST